MAKRIIESAMGDHPRRARAALLALVVAVACTGVVGYLISRTGALPQTPPTSQPSVAPLVNEPTPTAQPSADAFTVADDAATGQIVVYGGTSGTGSDTWVWNGAGWTLASPPMQPPPLAGASAVYDPVSRLVMLAGGGPFDGAGNDGTWGWDGETWKELDASISQPPVAGGAMAWDPALNQMILVTPASAGDNSSSQTWLWAGNRWIPKGAHEPFEANALQMAFDPATDALMAVSCCLFSQSLNIAGDDQIWRWDGVAWHLIANTALPATTGPLLGLSWDAASHSLLLCVQLFNPQALPLMPVLTWRLVGHAWVAVRVASAPSLSDGSIIQTDGGLRLVGADSTVEGSLTPYHVWAWSGSGWKQLG